MSDPYAGIDEAVAAAVAENPGAYTDASVVAQAPVAPVAPAPVAPAPDPLLNLSPEEYVDQIRALRKEAADYRTRMNEYLDVAGPLVRFEDEADIRAAHALVEALSSPDDFVGLYEQLLELPDFAAARERRRAPQSLAPLPQGLRPEDVERMVEQRIQAFQTEQTQAQLQAQIIADARSLGYNPDADMATDVAAALAFENLIAVAHRVTGGDLARAHALISGQQQAQVVAAPAPGAIPAPSGSIPGLGIDMSNYKGKGALDRMEKDMRVWSREGRL